MNNLYYLSQNFIIFGLGLLCTQATFLLLNKTKKVAINYERWFTIFLSLYFILMDKIFVFLFPLTIPLLGYIGVINIILLLPTAILSIKFTKILKYNILYWIVGVMLFLSGIGRLAPEYGTNPDCFIIALGWLLFTIVLGDKPIFKLKKINFLATLFLIIGNLLFFFANFDYYLCPHITVSNSSVKMKNLSATISGTATPNTVVKIFYNGKEQTPSGKSNKYGDFSFDAKVPGIWKLQVTKNGETETASVKVIESNAYHEKQIKDQAKEIIKDFSLTYTITFYTADSLGVDEYNAWLKYIKEDSIYNSPDEVIDAIQRETDHKEDIKQLTENIELLSSYAKQLKQIGYEEADNYINYYQDINSFVNIVVSPSGNISNFGDNFDSQRNIVKNDKESMNF